MSFCRRLFLLLQFVIITNILEAQPRFDFYVNPFVQKFGILDKNYTITSNEFIDVHYTNLPSQHVGLNLVFNDSKKYQFYVGAQYTTNHYRMDYRFFRPNYDPSWVVYREQEEFETQNLGLKFGVKRNINANIVINANVGFIAAYYPKEKSLHSTSGLVFDPEYINGTATGNYDFVYKYKIGSGGLYPQLFIPELSAEFNLTDQLYLNVGAQLKFWDLDKETGYIDVTVDGKTTVTNGSDLEQLHFSRIKRTEFNYFFGLTYRFLTKRK